MMGGRATRRFGKLLAYSILLAVFAARALIPAGFMPGSDSAGRATLILCLGDQDITAPAALASASLGQYHQHGSDGHGQTHPAHLHCSCSFALSGFVTAPPADVPHVVPPAVAEMASSAVRDAVFLPTILRAQSTRAPPSIA
jgi:hypothetical protein